LIKIDRVKKRLQDPCMNFHETSKDVDTMKQHFMKNREKLREDALTSGKSQCEIGKCECKAE